MAMRTNGRQGIRRACGRCPSAWWLSGLLAASLLACGVGMADDAPGAVDRLGELRAERDGLLRAANRAAAAGDTRQGDAEFAKVRELNAMITALRAERIRDDLARRQEALSRQLGDLGAYQTCFHDPFLLIVPAHDAEFAKLYRYLPQADQVLHARIGCRNRPATVTVVIAGRDRAALKALWRQASGRDDLPTPEDPLPWAEGVVADMDHGPAQLLAGMARAMVQADFPAAPGWYVTMLAVLNETSRIVIDPKTGRSEVEYPFNWRFREQAAADPAQAGAALREILGGKDEGDDAGLRLARLRHWALWLDSRGWLRPWHEAFRDYRHLDAGGIRQLEQVAGQPLDDLLREHVAWLARQRAPIRE
jgi:hypothetical protein